jgi:HAD superfamily hydrolase (TIGR01509 family)
VAGKNVSVAYLTEEYLEGMEDPLDVYEWPCDPAETVDEWLHVPCQGVEAPSLRQRPHLLFCLLFFAGCGSWLQDGNWFDLRKEKRSDKFRFLVARRRARLLLYNSGCLVHPLAVPPMSVSDRSLQSKAVIFDMDGVLIDSSAIHDAAFREVLRPYQVWNFKYSSIAGMRTNEALRLLLSACGVGCGDSEVAALSKRKSEIARAAISELNPVAPDCIEVLTTLGREHRLALASSASRETIGVFLRRNALAGLFEAVLAGDDVVRAKPDPQIYMMCCDRLGLPPTECLVIEDAVSGVCSAKLAGTFVFGLATGDSGDELRAAGADRIIHSLAELPQLCRGAA